MKKFIYEYVIALVAFTSQLSAIVAIVTGVDYFWYDDVEIVNIFLISLAILVLTFIVISKIKGGWKWFFMWLIPTP